MKDNMNVELYTDEKIEKLKEQIRFLEIEISLLASEKADTEKHIRQYENKFNREVGDLAEKVLQKRKEKLKKEAEISPNKEQEYHRADKEYQEFKDSYEDSKKAVQIELTDEEQLEIKTKFRRACQLCHPDKVADEFKEEAHKVFIELKEAYSTNNLVRVTEILNQLEKGIFKTGSQSITAKEKLLLLHSSLKMRLENLRRELKELKQSEVYLTITAIKDYDSHFKNLRQQLQSELNG